MEIIANELQTVLAGANVQFTDTVVPGKACTMHRPGSGLVSLKGLTNQCRARFKVSFGANIGLPTGGLVAQCFTGPAMTYPVLQKPAHFHRLTEKFIHCNGLLHGPLLRRELRVAYMLIPPSEKFVGILELQEEAIESKLGCPSNKVQHVFDRAGTFTAHSTMSQAGFMRFQREKTFRITLFGNDLIFRPRP